MSKSTNRVVKSFGQWGKMVCGVALGVGLLCDGGVAQAKSNSLSVGSMAKMGELVVALKPNRIDKVVKITDTSFHLTVSCRKDGYRPMRAGKQDIRAHAKAPATVKGTFVVEISNVNELKGRAKQACRNIWNINSKRPNFTKREMQFNIRATYFIRSACFKVKGQMFGSLLTQKNATVSNNSIRVSCDFRKLQDERKKRR